MGHPCSPETRERLRRFRTGKRLSAETRAKISAAGVHRFSDPAERAKIAVMRVGRRASEETRIRISQALKGRTKPPEWRAKLSAANTGKRPTPAARENMSRAQRKRTPVFGRKASPVTREKMRLAHAGKRPSAETRAKIGAAHRGKTISFETRTKLRDAARRQFASPEARAACSARSARQLESGRSKKQNTKPERAVAAWLTAHGVEHLRQRAVPGVPGAVWDFVLPDLHLIVEADGCYWHGCEACGFPGLTKNQVNDARKNALAGAAGWRLLRLKEHDIYSGEAWPALAALVGT